jgi:two-component system chemotaxis sensor kinase CheA
MADDPYQYFRIEARELTDQLAQGVLEAESQTQHPLESSPTSALARVAQLLRLAHTLKGAARVVQQPEIADKTHALEDVLEPYRGAEQPLTRDHIAQLLGLVDGINERLALLDTPPPGPVVIDAVAPRAGAAGGPGGATGESLPALRRDMADVDDLLETIGEAHAQLAPLRRGVANLERACQSAELLAEQLAVPAFRGVGRARNDAPGTAVPWDRIRALAADVSADLTALGRGLVRTVEQTGRELQQVRNSAERLRLVPARAVFTSLHRAVRDVAAAQDKLMSFEGRGGDVRLDPKVLAEVHGALMHVVRNAVAHGIEPVPQRLAAGKPAEGHVVVDVARRGSRVAFRCRDDGQGFDLEAVRRIALNKGLMAADGQEHGQQELVDLLLRGGISTSEMVTELSGRGIGLDVVRDVAERLGGDVAVATEPGGGSTVEIIVPLSLISLHGLVVDCAGVTTTIPLESVRPSMRLRSDEVAYASSGATVVHEGQAVPFLPLAQALGIERPVGRPAPAQHVGVVVTGAAGTAVIGVDRLLGTDTVVVRPLPTLAPASALVGGVSLDGEGNPRIVLEPDGLVAAAHFPGRSGDYSIRATKVEPKKARLPILVVDDSLTTRMLEQSILESAGYVVHLAASGEEALARAGVTRYGLFLVDIEMPGIDGITFIELTRADPSLCDIPAILVSSRASPHDRALGVRAGAAMHVEKSEFNQNELLDRIDKLVG